MDEHIQSRLDAQDQKLELIFNSVEKTRKYLLIIMWSSIAMIVLPLVFALFLAPVLINSYQNVLGSLL